jgi:hypothetical protein
MSVSLPAQGPSGKWTSTRSPILQAEEISAKPMFFCSR